MARQAGAVLGRSSFRRGAWVVVATAAALLGASCSSDGDGGDSTPGGDAGARSEPSGGTTSAGAGGATDVGGAVDPGGNSGTAGSGGQNEGGTDATAGEGGTGANAGEGGGAGDGGTSAADFPESLSDTGLYSNIEAGEIAAEALAYEPAFELWSDGASKRRWVLLPENLQVDSSDMDYWEYPVGTKFFKEFSVDERRVETRMLAKSTSGWVAVAYVWNEDGTSALAAPSGQRAVLGTEHDVPKQDDCKTCHDKMPDMVLGFTALQLSHEREGVTLSTLIAEDRLSDPPAAPLTLPGDEATRQALGYLHANCGICHNPRSFVNERVGLSLWLTEESLGSVETTPTYLTAVGKPAELADVQSLIVAPGDPEASDLLKRMKERRTEEQMPPLASKLTDPDGIAAVEAWISSLE